MLTMYEMLIVVVTWHFLLGVFLVLRWRLLSKRFKTSDYDDFLDFYEKEYLEKDKPTWRRKYSFIYRSKLYKWGHIVGVVVCGIILVLCIGAICYVNSMGYGEIFNYPM